MEKNHSWEANSFSASQKIPHFMEPEVSLPHSREPATCLYPEPKPSSPCTPSHFLFIHLNTIVLSTFRSSKWHLSLRSPHQKPECSSLLPIRATCPAYVTLLGLINRITICEQYRTLSSSLCSYLPSPLSSLLSCPNIPLSTLFSDTLSLRSSLKVNDQVSHPYNTARQNYISVCLQDTTW